MREIGKSRIEYPDTYIVVDIEATGLNPETERLIEVAAIKYINHKKECLEYIIWATFIITMISI